jgi:pimeloyl-ACP methyl ester carboxylesterase
MWIPKNSRREGVVFCHGWGGQAQYDDFLELLAEKGYYALRFDQRGYGESTGKSELSLWTQDMAAAASTLRNEVDKIWAAGQSTGGTMALVAAANYRCFAGAVALAPFCSLDRILEDHPYGRPILEARFGFLQEKDFRAADALANLRNLKKPVLIVHGTKDGTVPFEHGSLIQNQLESNARLLPVDGANHHLTNVDRRPIFDQILKWLENVSER